MIEPKEERASMISSARVVQVFRVVGCLVLIVLGLGLGAVGAFILAVSVGWIALC
jgi:hypothetical protein